MQPRHITGPDDLYGDSDSVSWVEEPIFDFPDEAAALEVLRLLGDDLEAARRQEQEVMRWLKAAAEAAHRTPGTAGRGKGPTVSKEAIIANSGLSRDLIYRWLGPADGARPVRRRREPRPSAGLD
ncbi:hypothetical protein ACIBH1_45070 [Nonomuraea sp. NPDC050663]|uniref:hypothetical protein n=1 Tax=Nonomuraea sp. NPDC050663 TaxID=3364370 RepID=UPI00378CB9A8